jgi:hypothetical protein
MSSPRSAAASARAAKSRVRNAARKAVKASAKRATNVGFAAEAARLAAEVERSIADGSAVTFGAEAVQTLMAAACRAYAAQIEAGERFMPLGQKNRCTMTDVMVTASGLLKASNLQVFELGMWQSWTGR